MNKDKAHLEAENAKLRLQNEELKVVVGRLTRGNSDLQKLIERICKLSEDTQAMLLDTGVTLLDSEITWLALNRRFNGNRPINLFWPAEGIEDMERILEKPPYSKYHQLRQAFITDANYHAIAERRKQLGLIP
jgi:hypothetical protein